MGILEDFTKFKADLKEKYLDYWEKNSVLFNKLTIAEHYKGKDEKNREIRTPYSSTILTIILFLEPKVQEYIEFIAMANTDKDKIVEILGLKIDPNLELIKRKEEREKAKKEAELIPPSPLDDFRQKNQELKN